MKEETVQTGEKLMVQDSSAASLVPNDRRRRLSCKQVSFLAEEPSEAQLPVKMKQQSSEVPRSQSSQQQHQSQLDSMFVVRTCPTVSRDTGASLA